MLHLAMFMFFSAASAASLALVVLMLADNGRAIVRALRMQPLHGHVPPAPVPPRLRVPAYRPAPQRQLGRAAA